MSKDDRKAEPKPPSDADAVLRAIGTVLAKHGWVSTSSQVDADGSIVITGKVKPEETPAE